MAIAFFWMYFFKNKKRSYRTAERDPQTPARGLGRASRPKLTVHLWQGVDGKLANRPHLNGVGRSVCEARRHPASKESPKVGKKQPHAMCEGARLPSTHKSELMTKLDSAVSCED